ncbi:hypothetical protein [Rubripirellula lacrimiformis]|nr:hypothetical protein [Rubripirellula lacrimiformis]
MPLSGQLPRAGVPENRSGIVLLVVLGMLTLFSVLGVSYLVFTSRQRSAAVNISRSETEGFDEDRLLDDALKQILVGSKGPESSLWGHDVLGDLYGMRDAIRGDMTAQADFVVASTMVAPNVLLNDFVRIPTELFRAATYANPRIDNSSSLERFYPTKPTATVTFATDEELSGRILTFTDGPLAGLSMKILRYFGNHLGPVTPNGRQILSGQTVLDMRPHLNRSITVDSVAETHTLGEWIRRSQLPTSDADHRYLSLLFYNRAPEAGTGAVPLSPFYVNGRVLNGTGLGFDAARGTGLTVSTPEMNINETVNVALNPNQANPSVTSVKSGYDYDTPATHTNTMVAGADVPVALQGNFALYRREKANPNGSGDAPGNVVAGYLQDLPAGDSDEAYDAPDEQNYWLSYFPTDTRLGAASPSFVRPGTLHWLVNQSGTALNSLPNADKLRQVLRAVQRSTMRPLRIQNDASGTPPSIAARADGVLKLDFSEFTGSNPSRLSDPINFAETNPNVLAAEIRLMVRALAGADTNGDGFPDWDVDNNGDGIPDSVWTDAGLSLIEAPDGTLIKPMVSYLVEDMGGRVNVNLAGNLIQGRGPAVLQKSAIGPLYRLATPTGVNVTHTDLAAGFGYGPAEINIRPLFIGSAASGNGALNLLRHRLNSVTYSSVEYVASGHLIDPLTNNGNDLPGMLRQPGLPNLHTPGNAQGMPVDKFGRSSIALGVGGDLMVAGASAAVTNAGASAGDAADDPYEMVMTPGITPDTPFTLSDLEGVLRFNDFDRDALDSALVNLAENTFTGTFEKNNFANSVTTISNSAAVNAGTLPQEWRDATGGIPQVAGGNEQLITTVSAVPPGASRNALLMQILPQDILAGGKMDLNRPFGNGIDNDGDGVIDDPEELRSTVEIFYRDYTSVATNTFYTTPYSDVTPGIPGPYSATPPPGHPFPEPSPQALFARHLYVMAMALTQDSSGGTPAMFDFTQGAPPAIDPSNRTVHESTPGSGTFVANTAEDEYRAWRLAQWAINVADFRDGDAIMSRFDYDVYPFDGWNISPVPPPGTGATSRTIWGMEFPELALEESFAFHDRRSRDTALDAAMEERFSGGSVLDADLDQWRIPQGSLFLEIRNTRSPFAYEVDNSTGELVAPDNRTISDTNATAMAMGRPPELYNNVQIGSRTGTNPDTGTPRTINSLEPMLDLAKIAPDRNPIWRIAVTPAHEGGDPTLSGDEMLQPVDAEGRLPFTSPGNRIAATLQPNRPDFFGPSIPLTDQVDRVVWFTNENPDNGFQRDGSTTGTTIRGQAYGDFSADDGFVDFAPADSQNIEKIFYNRFATADYPFQITDPLNRTEVHIRSGQYAVIGPRSVTAVGALNQHSGSGITHDGTTDEPLVPYTEYESPQRFLLLPNSFSHSLFSGLRATPTPAAGAAGATIRNPVGIIAAANVPTGFTGAPVVGTTQGIGLNVSEPLPYPVPVGTNRYYPTPTRRLKADFPFDSYYDYDASTGNFPDQPFDGRAYAELAKVFGGTALATGTRERFKTAYLQRLADPTEPHDEFLNPYISIDYITIDLTVFNGSEQNTQSGPAMEWVDDNDPDPFGNGLEEAFATRYKTGKTIFKGAADAVTESLSHSVNTYAPPITAKTTVLGGHIPYFDYTLNLQNNVNPDAPGGDRDANPNRSVHSSTLGYANASYGPRWRTTGSTDQLYAGTPYSNWLSTVSWLNRPYVSPAELMWVPTTSNAGFVAGFGTSTLDTDFTAGDVYVGDGTPIGAGERQQHNRMFPHLWNPLSTNVADFTTSPNIYRILDFVDVQAPFDFENDFLSTNTDILQFATAASGPAPNQHFASTFGNSINYQVFGTNVTGNPDTWGVGTTNASFWLNRFTIEAFRAPLNIRQPQFRQGKINLNTIKSPSVYRALMEGISNSADAAEGAFFDAFVDSRRGYALPGTAAQEAIRQYGVPASVNHFDPTRPTQFTGAFRPSNSSDLAPLATDRVRPLDRTTMRPGGTTGTFTGQPLFSRPSGGATINDAFNDRSVAHQQLPITRLNNLAADQSNAFAVWITVGLFKVDSSTLSVGDELGSDLGESRRLRSFHIIDRSVPVMYEPGEWHNAMETVLMSRKLN